MNFRESRLPLLILIFVGFSSACFAQSLRQSADRDGILIGTAVNPVYLSEPAYTGTLGREFNMVEAEDAMKWHMLRPDRNTFDFAAADRIVEFAREHNMKVRGHTLVWNQYNPNWIAHDIQTPERLSQLLHEHINRVVTHFKDKVFAWDVVNEAFDENGELRNSLWYNQPGIGMADIGTGYIEQALQWAHQADPDALLFYNDAGAEAINRKSDAIYKMAKDFRQRGIPLDGIGLQMHILDLNPEIDSIGRNIARFTALGLQIHITEIDVAVPVNARGEPLDPADLQRQAEIYRWIAEVCLKSPGCTAIQTWGFTDKYSWIDRFTHYEKGDALLFDKQYHPKPAYTALQNALAAGSPRKLAPQSHDQN